MESRLETALCILLILIALWAVILLPRAEWYRELQRLVPSPIPGPY